MMGCLVIAAASLILAYGKGRIDQARVGKIEAQGEQLKAKDGQIEALTLSIKANAEALESAVVRAQCREAETSNLEQEVKDYEAQLEKRGCWELDAHDAQRLRNIK